MKDLPVLRSLAEHVLEVIEANNDPSTALPETVADVAGELAEAILDVRPITVVLDVYAGGDVENLGMITLALEALPFVRRVRFIGPDCLVETP